MKIIGIVISVCCFSPLMGQNNLLYPEMFAGFFNHQPLINPSFQQDTGRIAVAASLKSRMGVFKSIATYYASLDRNFITRKNTGHTLRVLFYNEKEGPYIEKPRGYIGYAYRLHLSRQTVFAAGVSAGFAQIAFTAPSATATGTTTLPDASIGVFLKRKQLKAGVSSMQFFNNSSTASNFSVQLGRYYNFFAAAEKELGYRWKLNAYLFYSLLPAYKDHGDLALLVSYKNIFSFGTSARYRQGMSFFAGLNINTGGSIVVVNFAYSTPFLAGSTSLNNSFELSPAYILQ